LGKYGDLAPTIACILLDREVRITVLDNDAAQGLLKEPLMKVIGLMRSMEYTTSKTGPLPTLNNNMRSLIGLMFHDIPDVFSFFKPAEDKMPGAVTQASLVAPEDVVLTGSKMINLLNGMFALIKYGLSVCYGGFGVVVYGQYVCCLSVSG
jgi:hypothetical protein